MMKRIAQNCGKKLSTIKILAFTLGIIFLSLGNHAYAFDDESYSEHEKVGLAFYKLGNIEPNFDSWVRSSSKYSDLKRPRERAEFLADEKHRLEEGLRSYFPEFGRITIKSTIRINGMTPKERKNTDERYVEIEMDTESTAAGFYFPYPVGKEWVALIPRNMEKFSHIKVTPEQYDLIIGKNNQNAVKGKTKEGIMEIVIQPTSVDTSAPLEIDGIYAWLMDGEIASLAVWSGKKNMLVWEYTAPWYVSDTQRGIHGLYGK